MKKSILLLGTIFLLVIIIFFYIFQVIPKQETSSNSANSNRVFTFHQVQPSQIPMAVVEYRQGILQTYDPAGNVTTEFSRILEKISDVKDVTTQFGNPAIAYRTTKNDIDSVYLLPTSISKSQLVVTAQHTDSDATSQSIVARPMFSPLGTYLVVNVNSVNGCSKTSIINVKALQKVYDGDCVFVRWTANESRVLLTTIRQLFFVSNDGNPKNATPIRWADVVGDRTDSQQADDGTLSVYRAEWSMQDNLLFLTGDSAGGIGAFTFDLSTRALHHIRSVSVNGSVVTEAARNGMVIIDADGIQYVNSQTGQIASTTVPNSGGIYDDSQVLALTPDSGYFRATDYSTEQGASQLLYINWTTEQYFTYQPTEKTTILTGVNTG